MIDLVNKYSSGFCVALLFLFSLDVYSSNKEYSHYDPQSNLKNDRKEISVQLKKSLIDVLRANEKLHLAFYNYDGKEIEKKAIRLSREIAKIKDKSVAKLLSFSKKILVEIKSNSTRDFNNNNYHLVSMALIHIINTYDIGQNYNAYKCPMLKMKWIQNSKKSDKVFNPFSSSMPSCGTKTSKYK